MVRDEKSRVKYPADDVIDSLGRREGLVSTLMAEGSISVCQWLANERYIRNDPKTSGKEASHESVQRVQANTRHMVGNTGEVAEFCQLETTVYSLQKLTTWRGRSRCVAPRKRGER